MYISVFTKLRLLETVIKSVLIAATLDEGNWGHVRECTDRVIIQTWTYYKLLRVDLAPQISGDHKHSVISGQGSDQ